MTKYVRNEIKDEYGLLTLQDDILGIMVDIDVFCRKYKIDYCLMAGSALGARRHKGFIPWDDDIDIYMSEKDYLRFREKFESNGNKNKYYLQEWGSTDYKNKHMITMAKIRKNGTILDEKAYKGWKMHKGVFVDIFILHNCASIIYNQKLQCLWSKAVVLKGLEIRGYDPKGIKDKLMLTASKMVPSKWILNHGLSSSYKYQDLETDYFHGFIDTRKFSHALFPKEVIFPTQYVDFETVKLKVPANNDEYLRIQFGDDYMIQIGRAHV